MTEPILDYYGYNIIEKYIVNGEFHGDPAIGPAKIIYDINGKIFIKEYRVNNKLHNPYGPAWFDYRYDIHQWRFDEIDYTNEVNEYLNTNNLNYKTMVQTDFDIMWTCIL